MKANTYYQLVGIILISTMMSCSQQKDFTPDLTQISNNSLWTIHNREAHMHGGEIHLNGKPADGLLWLNDYEFSNGKIDLDIKGRDDMGKSFVGFAFHGLNDSTFDAVYFRPFNFKSPERNGHSVQYISHPINTWRKLRTDFPEKYENKLSEVPDPDSWFHATIVIDYPNVKVFVNNSDVPSLEVDQLSAREKGWLGFWVGHGSDGMFRNLTISPAK